MENLRTLTQLGITPIKSSRAEEFQIILRFIGHMLTPTEVRIAEAFANSEELSDREVANRAGVQSDGSVRVHIANIRRKCKSHNYK